MNHVLKNSVQLSAALQSRRKQLGWSQLDMAKKLKISQSRYSTLEQEPSRLTFDRMMILLAHLGFELLLQDKPSADSIQNISEW